LLVTFIGLAACTATESKNADQSPVESQAVTLGVGYIPNVQFAPLYVAQRKGFYADEGLDVKIEYGFENDFVALAAQGERDFAIASGDQVILARAQDLPITYVMKWYERFPVALMLGPGQPVSSLEELKNRKIGIPGYFGASFVGWKALVYGANLDESAVELEEIGFTQAAAVQQGAVDGAMVYIANEPIQLRNQGVEIDVIEISDYVDLVSNGLVVGEKLMADNPGLVQKMVRGSLRGLQYALDNPDEAFKIVREVIPEMTDEEAPVQRQVLDASIELWRSEQPGISNRQAWQDSLNFMIASDFLDSEKSIDVGALYTNQFVETK